MKIKVFIGWDSRFPLVSDVAGFSFLNNLPKIKNHEFEIFTLQLHLLKYKRNFNLNPEAKASTEFTYSRFLIPYLNNYDGFSIFVDNDVLCFGDLNELITIIDTQLANSGNWPALIVRKHPNEVKCNWRNNEKMQGVKQTFYSRKNWSSFMIMNCEKLSCWTKSIVEQGDGMRLHQFKDIPDEEIMDVDDFQKGWNILLPCSDEQLEEAKLIHYTEGGPWFKNYWDCQYANLWKENFRQLFGREFKFEEAI